MKYFAKLGMLIIVATLCGSFSVYATTYTSLHGADTGETGNISEIYYNVPTNFRVLIPPGTTYFSLSMICDNQAVVTTVARFGQAPSDYYPIPVYASPSAKTLDQAMTANIISGNSDGLLNVALQYFYPQPLAESQAGWFYVDIVGSGVRHVDYNLSVSTSVYTEWYSRKKGSIDCLCTQLGQCAMCDSGICTSAVIAGFSVSSSSITAGSSVSFTNTTSGSASCSWAFGDGTSYSGYSPPTHTYSSADTYTVTLTATPTDVNCSVSSTTQVITVSDSTSTKDSMLTLCDANADQKLGLEEVIYILQVIAGLRQ